MYALPRERHVPVLIQVAVPMRVEHQHLHQMKEVVLYRLIAKWQYRSLILELILHNILLLIRTEQQKE